MAYCIYNNRLEQALAPPAVPGPLATAPSETVPFALLDGGSCH
jgi:hypothetical protein